MAKKYIRLTQAEKDYITKYCLKKSIKQIAIDLNRSYDVVQNYIHSLGVKSNKDVKEAVDPMAGKTHLPSVEIVSTSKELNENKRKEFFKDQLKNSIFYDNLKQQLTDNEIEFYLAEWAALCLQFEDIVATEKRQIDELIKAEVMGNRILRNVKIAEEETENLVKEVEAYRACHDMEDEQCQERDDRLMSMIKTMYIQTQTMTKDYQSNVDLRNRLLTELNARRKDRIDQIKKAGHTLLDVIKLLKDREVRETQGKHIELMRIAKDKKLKEWRRAHMFPDGSKDCLVLDENSEILSQDIVLNEKYRSDLVNKYSSIAGKNILVLDNVLPRFKIFTEIFHDNTIEFAVNTNDAINKISATKFDLICCDYNLAQGENCLSIIDHLLQTDNTDMDILIHCPNDNEAEEIKNRILGKIFCEKCSFEIILEGYENAKNSASRG